MNDGDAVFGDAERALVLAILEDARSLGFLGPGPVDGHVSHSLSFATLVASPPQVAIDLGSGGGVPGLILALRWPSSSWALLDASIRRTDFLRRAVATLGIEDRVEVVTIRAEEAGRDPTRRGVANLVVARSFGPAAVTAECAAPLLGVGGELVVADPPGGAPDRWAAEGLLELGLKADGRTVEPALQHFRQISPCPDRYPRRTGIPEKRPLF